MDWLIRFITANVLYIIVLKLNSILNNSNLPKDIYLQRNSVQLLTVTSQMGSCSLPLTTPSLASWRHGSVCPRHNSKCITYVWSTLKAIKNKCTLNLVAKPCLKSMLTGFCASFLQPVASVDPHFSAYSIALQTVSLYPGHFLR
jgi:hypothetical protein